MDFLVIGVAFVRWNFLNMITNLAFYWKAILDLGTLRIVNLSILMVVIILGRVETLFLWEVKVV